MWFSRFLGLITGLLLAALIITQALGLNGMVLPISRNIGGAFGILVLIVLTYQWAKRPRTQETEAHLPFSE